MPKLTAPACSISNGRMDPIVSPEETERLARLLQRAGADVEVHWQPAGSPIDAHRFRGRANMARKSIRMNGMTDKGALTHTRAFASG